MNSARKMLKQSKGFTTDKSTIINNTGLPSVLHWAMCLAVRRNMLSAFGDVMIDIPF